MSFSLKAALVYDQTKIGTINSTNFPAVVDVTANQLKSVANGGVVTNSSGHDINFFADTLLATLLNWKVESYNATTGRLIARVLVPTLSTLGGLIYIAAGDVGITTFQGGAPSTIYDADYQAAHELPNGSVLSLTDAGQNAHNGTNSGATAATGLVDGGAGFVAASSQSFSIADDASLRITGGLTLEVAIKRSTAGAMRLTSKCLVNGPTNCAFDWGIFSTNALYLAQSDAVASERMDSTATVNSSNTWTHLAMSRGRGAFTNIQELFVLGTANRAWQGVAFDGTHLYVVSDRNAAFGLENIISKYLPDGTLVQTKTAAYNPGLADFFSFGDASIINGELYVAAYNFNSSPRTLPLQSRVARFNLDTLNLISEHNLGTNVGVAEGINLKDGAYWVIDGNNNVFAVSRYDTSFNFLNTITLPHPTTPTGLTYQTLEWVGNELFANLHGENTAGIHWAYGLDHWSWNGTAFSFKNRFIPVAEGTGQGIAIAADGTTFYWTDRIRNSIWRSTYVGPSNGDANPRQVTFFIDGVANSQVVQTRFNPTADTSPVNVGKRGDNTNFFGGTMDEYRISDIARTGAWMTATANNLLSPTTFWTLGAWTTPTVVPRMTDYYRRKRAP